ncbi:MAG: T9SS type A sorting domain-containing protein [Lewinellaceae bacterium]|nr:T9SS type A sorting domain-containing protein [Lewinellaceae bacterium]
MTILCLGSLPVELINFKAVVQTGLVRLLWSTATEKNNAGYEIERSGDHRNWSGIGFVAGNGNSVQRRDYEFTDAQPLAGPNYYRLKQMDTDGAYEYSPIVIADVRAGVSGFDVFPNPSSDGLLSFRIVNEKEGAGSLEIFDWVGYKVYRETIDLLPGTNVFPVSMASFPKGVYTARFEMPDGQLQFRKIMLR